jgi:hypothetical protein
VRQIAVGGGSSASASGASRTGSTSTAPSPSAIACEVDVAPPIARFWMRQCHTPATTGSHPGVISAGSLIALLPARTYVTQATIRI